MNIDENIAQLIVKYLSDEITEQEVAVLKNWLDSAEQNKDAFNRIKASWMLAGKQKEARDFDYEGALRKVKLMSAQHKSSPAKFKGISLLKIAASWLIIFMVGSITTYFILGKKTKEQPFITEVYAPLGAKSRVTLPDGTTLWLNAGSKITYDAGFNIKERIVQLTGEAFFHVKTNKAKPFIVKTSDIIVRALGTKFNVKAYPDEKTVTATLEEGKIDVQLLNSSKKQDKIVLKPKENIIFYKTGLPENCQTQTAKISQKSLSFSEKIEIQEDIKTELYTSWKESYWIIEGEPLYSLIPKLERRFNLKITYNDNDITRYKFTGTIKNESAEQIMKALSFTAPVDYKITKDTIRLYMNQNIREKFTRIITPKN